MIHAGESTGLYINSGGTRVIVRISSILVTDLYRILIGVCMQLLFKILTSVAVGT